MWPVHGRRWDVAGAREEMGCGRLEFAPNYFLLLSLLERIVLYVRPHRPTPVRPTSSANHCISYKSASFHVGQGEQQLSVGRTQVVHTSRMYSNFLIEH